MRLIKPATIKKAYRWAETLFFSAAVLYLLFFLFKYFVIGIFQVPTGSMQNTIMPGDWIVAEKLSFGAQVPWGDSLYHFSGLSLVKRGDVVVFHFPEGDTVFVNTPQKNYYEIKRGHAYSNTLGQITQYGETTTLPVYFRIPYVKRCVALPGDTLIIKNGIANVCPVNSRWQIKKLYKLYCNSFRTKKLNDILGYPPNMWKDKNNTVISLSNIEKNILLQIDEIDSIVSKTDNRVFVSTFPFLKNKPIAWSPDNYGPLFIPAKNSTVKLTKDNVFIYRRVIEVYENNKFELHNDSVFINNRYVKSYTFKNNYYFMMGDNRSFSFDSRNWGFVPQDHIIGRAFMIGWSNKPQQTGWESIRRNRVFKFIQ